MALGRAEHHDLEPAAEREVEARHVVVVLAARMVELVEPRRRLDALCPDGDGRLEAGLGDDEGGPVARGDDVEGGALLEGLRDAARAVCAHDGPAGEEEGLVVCGEEVEVGGDGGDEGGFEDPVAEEGEEAVGDGVGGALGVSEEEEQGVQITNPVLGEERKNEHSVRGVDSAGPEDGEVELGVRVIVASAIKVNRFIFRIFAATGGLFRRSIKF